MTRALTPVLVLVLGSAAVLACGAAKDNNFGSDSSAGEPGTTGGNGGSSQGGSGGSATGGSSGGNRGGASGLGGSASSGTANGGASGTGTTGGETTGGNSGTGGTAPNGGSGGDLGGMGGGSSGSAGQGGSSSGGAGQGGSGGQADCDAIVLSAQAALLAAQVCNPATSVPKCTGSVQDLCNCTVPVDSPDSEATKAYLAVREAALRCGVPCLAIVCPEPTNSTACMIGGATTNIVVAQSRCIYQR